MEFYLLFEIAMFVNMVLYISCTSTCISIFHCTICTVTQIRSKFSTNKSTTAVECCEGSCVYVVKWSAAFDATIMMLYSVQEIRLSECQDYDAIV